MMDGMTDKYVIDPVVSSLWNVLIDRLLSEDTTGRETTAAELSKLKTWLVMVDKVANDVEGKQDTDPNVIQWLNDVKHAVYDAEDLLNEILTHDLQKKKGLQPDSGKTTWLSALKGLNPFREDVVLNRLQVLNRRFEGVHEMITALHLETCVEQCRSLPPWRETSSFVDDNGIYGRIEERDRIIKILEDDVPESYPQESQEKEKGSAPNDSIRIVAIVGMAGIGKTTLAQLIFNHPNQMFQFKAWACVPEQEFDVVKTIGSILESSSDPASHYPYRRYGSTSRPNLGSSQRSLQKVVRGKRSLLVLDDVWDENLKDNFEALLTPLKNSAAPGTTIIMTTRNKDIATVVGAIPIQLDDFPVADCWNLFKMTAFGNLHTPVNDQRLESIITKMVENCKGLPLAIKVLGDHIRRSDKTAYTELESIANSNLWDPRLAKDGILPALLLSYRYLPPYLKKCFAYCSIFPKKYLFDKGRLIMLWMAEGFIVPRENDNRTMEDIGNAYFHDLLARSFFQVSGTNSHHFVMHDLIHDLAVHAMGDFGFMLKPNLAKVGTRHFSYVQSKYDTSERFRLTDEWSKQLRTFLPLGTIFTGQAYLSNDLLQSLAALTHLRVLSLCGYKITNIPHSIGNLKLLRYLDFSSTLIFKLPDSICMLSNLQTLLLSHCQNLKKLPEMMKHLIHLRHLDTRGTNICAMPEDVGSLIGLQTLTNFVIGMRSGNSIRELGRLSELRGTLRIQGLEDVVDNADALTAKLDDKSCLDEIVLEQINTYPVRLDLDAIKLHKNLKRLTIKKYRGRKFPDWLGDKASCNLEVLNLVGCPNIVSLPPLDQLPFLQDLLIKDTVGTLDPQVHRESSSFKSLVTLKLEGYACLKLFRSNRDQMLFPVLRELYIRNVIYEFSIPSNLPSLEVLDIQECNSFVGSLPQSPKLSKVILLEAKFLESKSLAELNCLTDLSFCLSQQVHMEGIRKVLPLLTSLESLTMKCKRGSPIVGVWTFPPLIQTITAKYCCQEIDIAGSTNIQYLNISGCNSIRLPVGLSKLRYLELSENHNELQINPDVDLGYLYDLSISSYELQHFPALQTAENLTTLSLVRCTGLSSLLNGIATRFRHLVFLSICDCEEITSFPDNDFPAELKTLVIKSCSKLESHPARMNRCTSLQRLVVENCPLLPSLPARSLPPKLHELHVERCNCENFTLFPDNDFPAELKSLVIESCSKLESLPARMHSCTSLQRLVVDTCPLLQSLPARGLPPNLQKLHVQKCKNLVRNYADWQLNRLSSLQTLYIESDSETESLFPADGSMPTSLTVLSIESFKKLRSINCRELQRIPSLRELDISDCPNLRSFSEGDLPQSLFRLSIDHSPLAARCRKPNGHYVDKTSHITCLQLDSYAAV